MRTIVVRQGEYLTKLAHRLGFDAAGVWNHPDNAALRERRPNPDQLQPGDVLRVPDAPADAGMRVARGGTLRASARAPEVELALALKGRDGAPIASVAFRVEGVGPSPIERTTDGDGVARFSVPVTVETCRVVLASGRAYVVRVGHMDPATEPSGVLKRLAHLGHARSLSAEDLETDLGYATFTSALRQFQRESGLEATGAIDEATVAALVERHGC